MSYATAFLVFYLGYMCYLVVDKSGYMKQVFQLKNYFILKYGIYTLMSIL